MDTSATGPTSVEPSRPDDGELPLATVLHLLPDAVLILDDEARVWWGNAASEQLFGLTRAEALGLPALDFVHPDDVELVLRSLVSVQDKEVGTLIEVRVATPRGWTLVEVIGRHVPEIEKGYILFCLRDVTERRGFEVAADDTARFRSIVQNAAFVTMLVSPDGIVESASAALTRLIGHDLELVRGRPLAELFVDCDQRRLERAFELAAYSGGASGPQTVELSCRRHDGSGNVPVELTVVSLLEDPTLSGFVVSMRDLSERAVVERELREALSLLNAALEATADGLLVVDLDGHIVSFNRRFAELWRIPDFVLGARDDAVALDYVTGQVADREAFLAKISELHAAPESESVDTLTFLDGRVFERYSTPQRVGDEVVGRVWSFRDVTERKRLEESLAHRAFHDSLTGLANKDLFIERLQRASDRTDHRGLVAVMFIDVDGLKVVNDRFGHHSGDALLTAVADVLRRSIGPGDTVARLGGDEFGIVMEGPTGRDEAIALAERILGGLPGSFTVEGAPVDLSVSIGIAFDGPDRSHADILREADAAMYSSKQGGRGRWEMADGGQIPGHGAS